MSETGAVFGRLLWPELTLITELDRKLAAVRIEHVLSAGTFDEEQARQSRTRLAAATTRADLVAAYPGSVGAPAPPWLLAAPRIGAAVWFALSLVDFVIWASMGLFSSYWEGSWLWWQVIGGAVLVVGLWWTREWDRRIRLSELDGSTGQ